jgi:hypothetical protein
MRFGDEVLRFAQDHKLDGIGRAIEWTALGQFTVARETAFSAATTPPFGLVRRLRRRTRSR